MESKTKKSPNGHLLTDTDVGNRHPRRQRLVALRGELRRRRSTGILLSVLLRLSVDPPALHSLTLLRPRQGPQYLSAHQKATTALLIRHAGNVRFDLPCRELRQNLACKFLHQLTICDA